MEGYRSTRRFCSLLGGVGARRPSGPARRVRDRPAGASPQAGVVVAGQELGAGHAGLRPARLRCAGSDRGGRRARGGAGWNRAAGAPRAGAAKLAAHALCSQPTLYWYLSGPTSAPLRLTLLDLEGTSAAPLLELELAPAPAAGVYGAALAEHGVELEPVVSMSGRWRSRSMRKAIRTSRWPRP